MSISFKKLILTTTFNFCLFIILIIGIQNSSRKSRINFLIQETVPLPISFIIGTSFITGSIVGGFVPINIFKK